MPRVQTTFVTLLFHLRLPVLVTMPTGSNTNNSLHFLFWRKPTSDPAHNRSIQCYVKHHIHRPHLFLLPYLTYSATLHRGNFLYKQAAGLAENSWQMCNPHLQTVTPTYLINNIEAALFTGTLNNRTVYYSKEKITILYIKYCIKLEYVRKATVSNVQVNVLSFNDRMVRTLQIKNSLCHLCWSKNLARTHYRLVQQDEPQKQLRCGLLAV